jgi:hypothetical protein
VAEAEEVAATLLAGREQPVRAAMGKAARSDSEASLR